MYQLGVWIKDALSTNTYDTYALETFQLLDPGCTSVAVGPDIASPSGNGVTVNFTASAVGCQTPQYEWWIRDVDGNWSVVAGHDFAHSSATFTWATTGLPAGAYQIGVWARDQQSLRSYDAYGITTYQLLGNGATGSACSAVNLASEQSPQGSSIITLDAASYGCSKAGFSFWIRDLSGNWSLIPYYSYSFGINTESYQWNSNGYSPGTYLLAVRATELPFPPNVAYESYSIITQVILPGNECSSAGLTPSVASPQASGAVISVSATVAGPFPGYCSPAEFRFFVAAPGGPFVGTQAYSATSGFTWNTAGRAPGVYQLGVWARQQGNGSAYEAYAIVSFTLT